MDIENTIQRVTKLVEYNSSKEEIREYIISSGYSEEQAFLIYIAGKLLLNSREDDEPITERQSVRALPNVEE